MVALSSSDDSDDEGCEVALFIFYFFNSTVTTEKKRQMLRSFYGSLCMQVHSIFSRLSITSVVEICVTVKK